MRSRISLFTLVTILVAQPALSDSTGTAPRQISEITFQNYPPRALAAGEQGPVFFVVKLDKDARATSCEVTHGSGHPLLDEETCELIVLYAVFKSAKDANGMLIKQTAEGVVNWTLPGQVPQPINSMPLAGQNKPDKQICKKTIRAGTIADVERTCMAESEWARHRDNERQAWEDVRGKGFSNKCGDGCESTIGQTLSKQPGALPPP